MQVIYKICEFKDRFKKNILSIGIFDGMHIGHKEILKKLILKAKEKNSKSVVLTFYPNPDFQFLIYPLSYRLKLLSCEGVDICVVIKFTKNFCNLEPEDFISKYIKGVIQPEEIIVGENFKFGKDAKGDINLLSNYAERFNFRLNSIPLKKIGSKVISSTWIRELLKKGDLKRIRELLNRDYSIFGKVIKGQSLGRLLEYPTANISTSIPCFLPKGVYCVEADYKDKEFLGVCYMGSRPTLSEKNNQHIEVHLFNFKRDIYRRDLEIRFIKKIRDEKKFSNVEELKKNIKRDIQKAKIFFHSLYHKIYPLYSA